MGVKGLWQLIAPVGKPISLDSLDGKVLAVDVSIWLNKAAKGMRDRHGNQVYNAHLVLMFHRICKLLFYGVKPVIVFDGGVPELKKNTLKARRDRKLRAESRKQKGNEAIIKNFLQTKALESITGTKSSVKLNLADKQKAPDLFELPPVSSQSESSEDEMLEDDEWLKFLHSQRIQEMFSSPDQVDIESEEFMSLPAEIKHELLVEIKEHQRKRFKKRYKEGSPSASSPSAGDHKKKVKYNYMEALPEEADHFSDYQLNNLKKRGQITHHIDRLRKEMNDSMSTEFLSLHNSTKIDPKNVMIQSRRIASDDNRRTILIKHAKSKEKNMLFTTSLDDDYARFKQRESKFETKYEFRKLERIPAKFEKINCNSAGDLIYPKFFSDDSSGDEKNGVNGSKNISEISMNDSKPDAEVLSGDSSESDSNSEWIEVDSEEEIKRKRESILKGISKYEAILIDDDHQTSWHSKDHYINSLSHIDVENTVGSELSDGDNKGVADKSTHKKENQGNNSFVTELKSSNEDLDKKDNCLTSDDVQSVLFLCGEKDLIKDKKAVTEEVSRIVEHSIRSPKIDGEKCKNAFITSQSTEINTKDISSNHIAIKLDDKSDETEIKGNNQSDIPGKILSTPKSVQQVDVNISASENSSYMELESPFQPTNSNKLESELKSKNLPENKSNKFKNANLDLKNYENDNTSEEEKNISTSGSIVKVPDEIRPEQVTVGSNIILPMEQSDTAVCNEIVDVSNEIDFSIENSAICNEKDLDDFTSAVAEKSKEDLKLLENELREEQMVLQRDNLKETRQAATLSTDMYQDVQELLRLFGIPYVVSPMEAEAQCAYLELSRLTDGSITDDGDVFLFGGEKVYKNIFNQKNYAELYQTKELESVLYLNRQKLIAIAFLTGSDYTEGLHGVGYVAAMEILHAFSNPEPMKSLSNFKEWMLKLKAGHDLGNPVSSLRSKLKQADLPGNFNSSAVWEAYLEPVVDRSEEKFGWGQPDVDAIKDFASEKLGWLASHTNDILKPVLTRWIERTKAQKTIDRYFSPQLKLAGSGVTSKRLLKVLKNTSEIGDDELASIANDIDDPLPCLNINKNHKQKTEVTTNNASQYFDESLNELEPLCDTKKVKRTPRKKRLDLSQTTVSASPKIQAMKVRNLLNAAAESFKPLPPYLRMKHMNRVVSKRLKGKKLVSRKRGARQKAATELLSQAQVLSTNDAPKPLISSESDSE